MLELIFNDVWSELKKHWQARPRFICVPYYSCDEGTELSKGDILVVNATDDAIKSGQTDPAVLRRAFERGATIWSHPDLHAKVYVLGTDLFVGSANASLSARNALIECLVRSADTHAVGQAISFIAGLEQTADEVDDDFLKRIEKLPVIRLGGAERRRPAPHPPRKSRCWLLGMTQIDFPGDIDTYEDTRKELQGLLGRDQAADWFWWPKSSSLFYREAEQGDVFVEIWRPNPERLTGHGVEVSPPAVIHLVEVDDSGRKVFYFAEPKREKRRPLSWAQFKKLVQEAEWAVRPTVGGCRMIPERHARELERLWPK